MKEYEKTRNDPVPMYLQDGTAVIGSFLLDRFVLDPAVLDRKIRCMLHKVL